MALVALKSFPYASRSIAAGELFDAASDLDARMLITTRMAVAEDDVDAEPVPIEDDAPPMRRRRSRRALAAE